MTKRTSFPIGIGIFIICGIYVWVQVNIVYRIGSYRPMLGNAACSVTGIDL